VTLGRAAANIEPTLRRVYGALNPASFDAKELAQLRPAQKRPIFNAAHLLSHTIRGSAIRSGGPQMSCIQPRTGGGHFAIAARPLMSSRATDGLWRQASNNVFGPAGRGFSAGDKALIAISSETHHGSARNETTLDRDIREASASRQGVLALWRDAHGKAAPAGASSFFLKSSPHVPPHFQGGGVQSIPPRGLNLTMLQALLKWRQLFAWNAHPGGPGERRPDVDETRFGKNIEIGVMADTNPALSNDQTLSPSIFFQRSRLQWGSAT